MDTTHLCPSCGKSLAPNAPKGLCPACLMKAAFPTGTQDGANPSSSAEFVPPRAEELSPHFPQLEILECLGRGGMGVVYKARQKTLNRYVALKLLAPEKVKDPLFAERFLREAQALARLNHPNIVTVYDFGESNGLYFLLMEFMDGLNLRELLRARKIAPAEALGIVPCICEALQYAHDQGIVHRDIKPENILLDKQGRVKIADFGIAKLLGQDGHTTLTQDEQVIGTPHYMAPEQTEKPQSVDHRADIYSLGVVFYEMLTGELPLGKFQPPSQKVTIDVRLDEVVLRALEKEPERRFQTARVLKTQVETIATTPPRIASAGTPSGLYAPEDMPRKKINWIPALAFYAFADTVWLTAALTAMGASDGSGFAAFFFGMPFWCCSTLLWAILHYSCWKALPPKYRATTPARAIGGMFIPFFNWYWAFVTYPQLAEGFNALRAERPDLPMKDVKGLGIAAAVVFVLCWTIVWVIPFTPIAVALADLILFILFYHGTVTNANLVIESARGGKGTEAPGWPTSAVGALVMTCVSIPIGAGALCWLIGILADSSWNSAPQERSFTVGLFGAALVSAAACVSFGVVTLRRLKSASPPLRGRAAALVAVWHWPCLLVLAFLGYVGYSRVVASERVRAEAEKQAAIAQEEKVLASLPGAGRGVPVGAVVERVVNESDSELGNEALCLKTARLLSFGDTDLTAPGAVAAWCRTNGVDLLVGRTGKRRALMTAKEDGLALADFPNDRWATATIAEVADALTKESKFQHAEDSGMASLVIPKNPALPLTFAFRTRAGAEGLLQVTAMTDDPAAVRLRYKFLQAPATDTPPPSATSPQGSKSPDTTPP